MMSSSLLLSASLWNWKKPPTAIERFWGNEVLREASFTISLLGQNLALGDAQQLSACLPPSP